MHITSRTICALALMSGAISAASAADLPAATKKALAELKLESSIMDGLDAELEIPKAWVEGAAQEKGGVIILGTWQEAEFRRITESFVERYPSIKLNYVRATSLRPRHQGIGGFGYGARHRRRDHQRRRFIRRI